MYVGLIDDDVRFGKLKYPNLEIMKLASYYKNNRDIVELCTDYRTFERYSKIIIRKNKNNNDFPSMLMSKVRDRCEYGGYAFTSGMYIPMKNEIEKSLPDVTIYDKIKSDKKLVGNRFNSILQRVPLRLETSDGIPERTYKGYLVYDKNVLASNLIDELLNQERIIEFVEKQYCDKLEDAIKLASSETMFNKNIIYYQGNIDAAIAKEYAYNFKIPIYYELIPKTFSSVSFSIACDVLMAYFNKIESVYRLSSNFRITNPFANYGANVIIDIINTKEAEDLDKAFKRLSADNYKTLMNKHFALVNRIKQLWRYKNESI